MLVKIINEISDTKATELVNAFLFTIKDTHELVRIKYQTIATQDYGWNCIFIMYKEL